jgi:hypothetical protein
MSTAEEKLREATRKVAANRDAARAAALDQVPGESGDQVQSSRAQQSPPAPQTTGEPQ